VKIKQEDKEWTRKNRERKKIKSKFDKSNKQERRIQKRV